MRRQSNDSTENMNKTVENKAAGLLFSQWMVKIHILHSMDTHSLQIG